LALSISVVPYCPVAIPFFVLGIDLWPLILIGTLVVAIVLPVKQAGRDDWLRAIGVVPCCSVAIPSFVGC
jgi:hypothetical protein